ncbi:MAG TPA: hypothetical protein VG105_12710 [Paraburkholderia sp.]|jgi:hypothetical protein|nr:hypothetical protein [Paraburkholderia sp.]
MGRRAVDNLTLERWRALDAILVLEKLGCYAKADDTFEPIRAQGTLRYHVNAEGRNFELLIRGPKFFDTRLKRGGGGALDLVMHLHHLDFKGATALLRRLAV